MKIVDDFVMGMDRKLEKKEERIDDKIYENGISFDNSEIQKCFLLRVVSYFDAIDKNDRIPNI